MNARHCDVSSGTGQSHNYFSLLEEYVPNPKDAAL